MLLAGVAEEATVSTLFVTRLFVSVTVALFFVASEVLSTLPRPTSPFTIPVGVFITGEVRVLLVRVSVVAFPTRVSVALGRSIVLLVPVELLRRVVSIQVQLLVALISIRFVSSVASQILTTPVPLETKCNPIFASSPIARRCGGFPVAPFSISR